MAGGVSFSRGVNLWRLVVVNVNIRGVLLVGMCYSKMSTAIEKLHVDFMLCGPPVFLGLRRVKVISGRPCAFSSASLSFSLSHAHPIFYELGGERLPLCFFYQSACRAHHR